MPFGHLALLTTLRVSRFHLRQHIGEIRELPPQIKSLLSLLG